MTALFQNYTTNWISHYYTPTHVGVNELMNKNNSPFKQRERERERERERARARDRRERFVLVPRAAVIGSHKACMLLRIEKDFLKL